MEIRIIRPAWLPEHFPVEFLFRFPRAARRMMKKHLPIRPSVFAEKYRVLTDSAIKGPWRNIVTPYLPELMDAADYPSVQTLILCKCVQSAGSEAAHNFVGYVSDRKPGPVMYVYPNKDAGKKQLSNRIVGMFKNSPYLSRHLTGVVDDETSLALKLRHMTISIAWAHSAASLASDPMCYMIFDEVDKYPPSAGKAESDPISLGEKRTTTYKRRRRAKIWKLSTPTTYNGAISVALREEAQVIFDFCVQCPDCGGFQIMVFSRIKWPGGSDADPEQVEAEVLAWYECEFCGGIWDDEKRNRAVRGGQWRSRGEHPLTVKKYLETYNPIKIGFHLPAWISYFVSLSESAAAFLRGQKSKTKLKDFLNNYAAEPWKDYEVIATPKEDEVLKCICDLAPQTVPESAVALTSYIDVQKVGFWFVVRAWAKDFTNWNIAHGHLGNWRDLENLLFETVFPVQNQEYGMRIWRAGIDTGGGKYKTDMSSTEETYLWLQDHMGFSTGCRVWGMKGSSNPLPTKIKMGSVLNKTPSGKNLRVGMRLVMVDTDKAKDVFFDRMEKALQTMPGGSWLHSGTGLDYARQIVAEQKREDDQGVESWVRVGGDNHYLDCEAGAGLLADWEWPGGGVNLLQGPVNIVHKEKPAAKKPAENPFTGGQTLFGEKSW